MRSEKRTVVAKKNVLITGRPGVGKTTVMRGLSEHLAHLALAGFYTDEIRQGSRRQGFRAVTFGGGETVLAHVAFRARPRVGRYRVNIAGFEELILPELDRPADLLLIDEIGKMECFSSAFVSRVRELLDGSTPVAATVAMAGGGFIGEVKSRADVEIVVVTRDNRDHLPRQLAARLLCGTDQHQP